MITCFKTNFYLSLIIRVLNLVGYYYKWAVHYKQRYCMYLHYNGDRRISKRITQ